MTTAIARPIRAGGTTEVPAANAAAMNRPWTAPVRVRATRNSPKLVVSTAARLPRTNRASAPTRTVRLFSLIVAAVRIGPPIARPSA